jgi:hypothetical protein
MSWSGDGHREDVQCGHAGLQAGADVGQAGFRANSTLTATLSGIADPAQRYDDAHIRREDLNSGDVASCGEGPELGHVSAVRGSPSR